MPFLGRFIVLFINISVQRFFVGRFGLYHENGKMKIPMSFPVSEEN